ncbi:60S ribosomal protein L13a-like protein [Cricetulus griseus]|nr:60S ribosomal protein L13a-like protein [Cricetulus griseus]
MGMTRLWKQAEKNVEKKISKFTEVLKTNGGSDSENLDLSHTAVKMYPITGDKSKQTNRFRVQQTGLWHFLCSLFCLGKLWEDNQRDLEDPRDQGFPNSIFHTVFRTVACQ